MDESAGVSTVTVPRHLWIIGSITLLWNAMGVFDYLMTQSRNANYMSNFTPEQQAYFYSFPSWAVAAWAVAVWGAMLGSLLLLLRKKAAAPVFLVAFTAMVLTTIYNFVLSDGLEQMGGGFEIGFSAIIFVVALVLWRYAAAMRMRGVLR